MAARALFLVAAVTTTVAGAVLGVAHGASYTVGTSTNYTRWASAVTFRAGDQLVFKYPQGAHNVVEVSKAGHNSCSASTPLASFATSDDTVTLPAAGVTRYFICGVPGHCAAGMKLAVRVEAAIATTFPSLAPAPVAAPVAPRAVVCPPTTSLLAPSPAPGVAMAPREGEGAHRPMTPTLAGPRAPAVGDMPAMPPSSSEAASAGSSLAGLGFGAAVAALMFLYYRDLMTTSFIISSNSYLY